MYKDLVWQADRMLLGDLVFRLEHFRHDNWELGDQCFRFYKTKQLVDQYARFWLTRPAFAPKNMLELGIWDGGSLAFWFETFHPTKLIGLDIEKKETSPYLHSYMRSRDLGNRLKLYWGTDQSDAPELTRIVATEFSSPVDLVIDDASHEYVLTKSSFETLFPLIRPGGLYIIEDWAWEHWKGFRSVFQGTRSLTDLVQQLVAATGSWSASLSQPAPLIASITVLQGFTVVERGEMLPDSSKPFVLEDYIYYDRYTAERTEDQHPAAEEALVGLSGRDVADHASLRAITQALALKLAARRGFRWLNLFKPLGKRLLSG